MKKIRCWKDWECKPPTPGTFCYVRDIGCDWEVAWIVGEEGNTKAMVANDPSMSRIDCDEWQALPSPSEAWIYRTPPSGIFVYFRDEELPDGWGVGWVLKDSKVKPINFTNSLICNEWQPVNFPNI